MSIGRFDRQIGFRMILNWAIFLMLFRVMRFHPVVAMFTGMSSLIADYVVPASPDLYVEET